MKVVFAVCWDDMWWCKWKLQEILMDWLPFHQWCPLDKWQVVSIPCYFLFARKHKYMMHRDKLSTLCSTFCCSGNSFSWSTLIARASSWHLVLWRKGIQEAFSFFKGASASRHSRTIGGFLCPSVPVLAPLDNCHVSNSQEGMLSRYWSIRFNTSLNTV